MANSVPVRGAGSKTVHSDIPQEKVLIENLTSFL